MRPCSDLDNRTLVIAGPCLCNKRGSSVDCYLVVDHSKISPMFNRKILYIFNPGPFSSQIRLFTRGQTTSFLLCKASRKPWQPRRQSTYQRYWQPLKKKNGWLVICQILVKTKITEPNDNEKKLNGTESQRTLFSKLRSSH